MSKTPAELVREARESKRVTLRQLAEMLGVSAPYLSDIEHGRRPVTEKLAEGLERTVGIDRLKLDFAIRRQPVSGSGLCRCPHCGREHLRLLK